jgi:tetratricopeptide (TPR) repeat protein
VTSNSQYNVIPRLFSCVDSLNKTEEINKFLSICHSNRSLAYFKLKNFEKASEDAESCISLNPEWFKRYVRKAMYFDNFGNMKEYSRLLNIALEKTKTEAEQTEIQRLINDNEQVMGKIKDLFKENDKKENDSDKYENIQDESDDYENIKDESDDYENIEDAGDDYENIEDDKHIDEDSCDYDF